MRSILVYVLLGAALCGWAIAGYCYAERDTTRMLLGICFDILEDAEDSAMPWQRGA